LHWHLGLTHAFTTPPTSLKPCRHYLPWLADGIAKEVQAQQESARALQGKAGAPATLPQATTDAIREYFSTELELHEFATEVHRQQLQHVRAVRGGAGSLRGSAGSSSSTSGSSYPASTASSP